MKKNFLAIALMSAVALAWATPSSAASITIYNTGVDSSTGLLLSQGQTDANYVLTSPSGPATSYAMVETWPIAGYGGPWLGNDSESRWIGPSATGGTSAAGTYQYTTTFTIGAGYNPATALIQGRWATDNDGISIVLNNTIFNFTTPFSTFQFSPFVLDSGFQTGVNTLTFRVNNGSGASGNPTGLRVAYDVASVPDGGVTLLLLGGALLGLGAVRRRFNL